MTLALVLWYHWSVPPVHFDYDPAPRYWITEEPPAFCGVGICAA